MTEERTFVLGVPSPMMAARSKSGLERYRAIWDVLRAEELARLREWAGPDAKGTNVYGEVVRGKVPEARDISGAEMVAQLRRFRNVTMDPRFSAAIAALEEHGLDKGKPRKSAQAAKELSLFWHLPIVRMRPLLAGLNPLSEREAAARTAVEMRLLDYPNFDAAVDDLRTRYRAWKRAGFPHKIEVHGHRRRIIPIE